MKKFESIQTLINALIALKIPQENSKLKDLVDSIILTLQQRYASCETEFSNSDACSPAVLALIALSKSVNRTDNENYVHPENEMLRKEMDYLQRFEILIGSALKQLPQIQKLGAVAINCNMMVCGGNRTLSEQRKQVEVVLRSAINDIRTVYNKTDAVYRIDYVTPR